MKVFKKQETIVQNMTYMGLMAAVNVVFVLLTYFIPFLLFVLVLLLPLCSAIISYYCKKIYFPIYLIVVTAICVLIDPADTIFYVLPSLITGFIFGTTIEFKVQSIYIVVIATIVQFAMSIGFIPIIKLITNRDIVYDLASIFGLQEYAYLEYIKYTFIFFVAFAQIVLTFIVMHSELSKFGIDFVDGKQNDYLLDIFTVMCVAMSVLFGFIMPTFSFIWLFLAFIFSFYRVSILDFAHFKLYLIEAGVIVLLSIFLVAILYPVIPAPLGLLTLNLIPLCISVACNINKCLLSKRNKDTINS